MSTQKINERIISDYLKNLSTEEAIVAIAKAMTNRDAIIAKLKSKVDNSPESV